MGQAFAIYDAQGKHIAVMYGNSAEDALSAATKGRIVGSRPARALDCSKPMDHYTMVRSLQTLMGAGTSTDLAWAMVEALEDHGWLVPADSGLNRWVYPGHDEWERCKRAALLEVE